MARTVSFRVFGELDTQVTVQETEDGGLLFFVELVDGASVGDLGALFFDLIDPDSGEPLDLSTLQVAPTSLHDDVTAFDADQASVSNLGQGQNVNGHVVNQAGKFDVGIRFGTPGIGKDDIRETGFLLSSDAMPLSLDMLAETDMAVRYTSVGSEGGRRNDSLKILGRTAAVAQNDVLTVAENTIGDVNVLANDGDGASRTLTALSDNSDTDGDVLTPDGGGFVVEVDGSALGLSGLQQLGFLSFATDGTTTFDADGADVDALALGESLSFDFTYTSVDGFTTAEACVTITIEGVNDQPDIFVNAAAGDSAEEALTETDAPLSVSGTLSVLDLDQSDIVTASWAYVGASGTTTGGPSVSALAAMLSVSPTQVIDGVSTAGGLSWTFDSGSEAFDYLAIGETLNLDYLITVTDDSGAADDSDTQAVRVTVAGSNDAPAFGPGDRTAELTEVGTPLTAMGTIDLLDPDFSNSVGVSVSEVLVQGDIGAGRAGAPTLGDLLAMLSVPGAPVVGPDGTSGSFDWTFSSDPETFRYLTQGEKLVLTYSLLADDGEGVANSQTLDTVTITIIGANEPPEIQIIGTDSAAETRTETEGGITIDGTFTILDENLPDTVTLSIVSSEVTGDTDSLPAGIDPADLLTLSSDVVLSNTTSLTERVTWTFDSLGESFANLGLGEALRFEYVLRAIDDSGGTPDSDEQTLTITIEGANAAPVISVETGDTASGRAEPVDGNYDADGTLTLTDVDLTDTASVDVVNVTSDDGRSYNTSFLTSLLTLTPTTPLDDDETSDGFSWRFDASTDDFSFIPGGEEVTFDYVLQATDDSGATNDTSDIQVVSVTIVGAFNPPDIFIGAGQSASDVLEDVEVPLLAADGSITDFETGLFAGGQLSVTDPDPGEIVSLSVLSNVETQGDDGGISDATFASFFSVPTDDVLDGTRNTAPFAWSFTPDFGLFDYLDDGEVLSLTFTVEAEDSRGQTDQQEVEVTVVGKQPPEIMLEVEETLIETNAPLTSQGTLRIVDNAGVDNFTVLITSDEFTGATDDPAAPSFVELARMVSLEVQSIAGVDNAVDAVVTFDSAPEAFDYLALDEVLTLNFILSAEDTDGRVSTAPVTFSIEGTNDGPDIFAGAGQNTQAAFYAADFGAPEISAQRQLSVFDWDDLVDITLDAAATTVSITGLDPNLPASQTPFALSATEANALFFFSEGGTLVDRIDDVEASIGTEGDEPYILNWEFNATDDNLLDALKRGGLRPETEVLITYTIDATDEQGAVDDQQVTVRLTGNQNVPPRIDLRMGEQVNRFDEDEGKPVFDGTGTPDAYTISRSGEFRIDDANLEDAVTATVELLRANAPPAGLPTDAELAALLTLDLADFANGSGTVRISDPANTVPSTDVGWNFDADNSVFASLAPGQAVALEYIVTVTDSGDASSTQLMVFEARNVNSAPLVTEIRDGTPQSNIFDAGEAIDVSQDFVVADLNVMDSLNITGVGFDAGGETPFVPADAFSITAVPIDFPAGNQIAPPIVGPDGPEGGVRLSATSDGDDFDFLSGNQPLGVKLFFEVSDGEGGTNRGEIGLTIFGTDDPTSFDDGADFALTLSETTDPDDPISETFATTITDLDDLQRLDIRVDGVEVTGGVTDAGGKRIGPTDGQFLRMLGLAEEDRQLGFNTDSQELNWTLDSAPETFNYLGAGQDITLAYTVVAEDPRQLVPSDPEDGSPRLVPVVTAEQLMEITLQGTNDQPRAIAGTIVAQAVSSETTSVSGIIRGEDDDFDDTLIYDIVTRNAGGEAIATDQDGNEYVISLAGDVVTLALPDALKSLEEGEPRILTFDYVADDQNGFADGDAVHEASVSDAATATITIYGAYEDAQDLGRNLVFETEGQSQFYTGEPEPFGEEPGLPIFGATADTASDTRVQSDFFPFIGIEDVEVEFNESFGGQRFENGTLTSIINGISSVVETLAEIGCEITTLGFGDCDVDIDIPSSITLPGIEIDIGVTSTIGVQPFFQFGSGELASTVPIELTFLTPHSINPGDGFVIETGYSILEDAAFTAGPAQIQFGLDLVLDVDPTAEVKLTPGKIGSNSIGSDTTINLLGGDRSFALNETLFALGPNLDDVLADGLLTSQFSQPLRQDQANSLFSQINPTIVLDLPEEDLVGTGIAEEGYAILERREGFEVEVDPASRPPTLPPVFQDPGRTESIELENPDKREADFIGINIDLDSLANDYTRVVPPLEYGYTFPELTFDALPGTKGGNTTLLKGGISFELVDVDVLATYSLIQDFRMDIEEVPITVTFFNETNDNLLQKSGFLGDLIIVEDGEITDAGPGLDYRVDLDVDAVFESLATLGFDLQLFIGLLKGQVTIESDYIPNQKIDFFPSAGEYDSDGNQFPGSDGYVFGELFELINENSLETLYENEFEVAGWAERDGNVPIVGLIDYDGFV